ncbi:MAG: PAS domain-containing sensor histidine kinase [Rhodanobacter sp.]|nr:MAG: PAS domain-containing sensor histidine kinase [Rhodanobacter sp.]
MAQITPHDSFDSFDRIGELEQRLREAEETLEAIRNGDVDAVVVGGTSGQQVYTLESADRPYRVLIEQMQESAVTLGCDGTILYCNQRLATLVGRLRSTLIGQHIQAFLGSHERARFDDFLALDASRSAEFNMLRQDSVEVPVTISMVELAVEHEQSRIICCVVTDLSAIRKRRDELASANILLANEIEVRTRAEASLQLALDAADMGNWDLDLITGNLTRSSRYNQIFGHFNTAKTWDPSITLAHFLAADQDAVTEAFARARLTGVVDFEKRIRRPTDNAIRWIQVRGLTYYRNAAPVRIAGVVSDITERRLLDEQLRQAQKMEAIGQLTGGIAHDFNNLLMIIAGSLDLLEIRVADNPGAQLYLTTARQGVSRGAKLTQQLLAFSRRQDLRVEAVCLDQLIATFQNLLDRAIGETVILNIAPAAGRWLCQTDPHQLETAILNLAINARDAMPQGGTLTIATETRSLDQREGALLGGKAGDYVVVSITDTGTGMSPDMLTKVFEPFFTTKEIGKGTGLGLSQVYGFARQSGGFVSIASVLGQGTTVSILLPRAIEQTRPRADDSLQEEVRGSGTVLVVEDDHDVRQIAGSMLRNLGYRVLEADKGRTALKMIEQHRSVDLVFSDVIMPGEMSGFDLARAIKAEHPRIPILLTSGYTGQQGPLEAVHGDAKILRKPYSQIDLSIAVRAALQPPAPK